MTSPGTPARSLRPEHLNVETSGPEKAPPLLLLHGWGSSAQMMRPIAERLAREYRTYNVDLPGHGHSPPPPKPWGVIEHAALVESLIREHIGLRDGQKVTIIGHSNGGRIALHMASDPEQSHLLRRLVLISPSGITPERSLGVRLRAGLARTLKAPFEILPEPPREFLLDWLRHSLLWKTLGSSDYRQLDGVMRETFVKTVNYHLDERVERIQMPVLIFWGENDEAVSERQIRFLEEKIPDTGVVVLEDAGHYGYLEELDTFIESTRYFLEHS